MRVVALWWITAAEWWLERGGGSKRNAIAVVLPTRRGREGHEEILSYAMGI